MGVIPTYNIFSGTILLTIMSFTQVTLQLPHSLPQFLGALLAPSPLPLPSLLLPKVFLVATFLSLVLVSPSNSKSRDECQTKIRVSSPFPKDLLYLLFYLFVISMQHHIVRGQ